MKIQGLALEFHVLLVSVLQTWFFEESHSLKMTNLVKKVEEDLIVTEEELNELLVER